MYVYFNSELTFVVNKINEPQQKRALYDRGKYLIVAALATLAS